MPGRSRSEMAGVTEGIRRRGAARPAGRQRAGTRGEVSRPGQNPQPLITVACTVAGCEAWWWRGPERQGRHVRAAHEESHRRGTMRGSDAAVIVIRDIPGESERDRVGRIVREVWVQGARDRGDTRPSHLTPYAELDVVNRFVDQRIGVAIAADARARAAEAARSQPQVAYVAQMEGYDNTGVLAVFADQDEAAGWLTRWHEANADLPRGGSETSAWPAAYVPPGGVQPDPADPAPGETALQLSWEREAGARGGPDAEAGR